MLFPDCRRKRHEWRRSVQDQLEVPVHTPFRLHRDLDFIGQRLPSVVQTRSCSSVLASLAVTIMEPGVNQVRFPKLGGNGNHMSSALRWQVARVGMAI